MKDGNVNRSEEPAEISRHELYEHYGKCYLQLCPEVRPCRDAWLLEKAAQYLLREPEPGPEPGGTFTVFPLYQAVRHRWSSQSPADSCKHLAAVIRAAEHLETICVNLFLQPWRKEIRTLKTFTGPFVYCLLPVLSSSTIQSVLAFIGYLLHTDSSPSEYRLSEDASPDRAMLLGFELMLARVECHHLLELMETDQLGPQELLEVLQRRVEPTNLEEPSEKKTTGQKEEEEKKKRKKKEEGHRKEVPQNLDTRRAAKPQLKPRPRHLVGVDQSIMEMQMTYPDLAFRGRPLLRDKPQRANSCKSSSTDVHTSSTGDGSKATELPNKAAAITIHSKNDGSDEVFGAGGGSSGCNDTAPEDSVSSSSSNTDGSRADELSGPQAVSLHIAPGGGATAEHSLKPGEPQPAVEPLPAAEPRPATEPPAWTQQHAEADLQSNGAAKPRLSSLSSMDEAQELKRLAERMGQLHVQDTKEEVKRGEENTKKERRKKERKASTEEEAEEPKLKKKPSMQTAPALSHAASRGTTSSQCDPARTAVCHRSPLTVAPAEHQTHEGGDSSRQQDGDDTERPERVRGEEELLDQSFVLVEHHEK